MRAFAATATDGYPTATSRAQAATETAVSQLWTDDPPLLDRNSHVNFLARCLIQGLPSRFQGQDASQPWHVFWVLQSLCLLGVGLDPGNKQKAINTIMAMQHPDGGFGGGPKQAPHLLTTYAAVSALAIVGRPGPDGGWDQIDRQQMYNFFMSLKQPDGSFVVSPDSEVDIRGIYCLLVTATLLDLLTPALVAGLPAFIASCQTFEGGFACASHPYFAPSGALLAWPRPALGEAHGGYSFCAVAAWCMLRPFADPAPAPALDMRALLRWLANMQGGPAELGGFRGRTNKLVDGCYSWWLGAEFGLAEYLSGEAVDRLSATETATNGDGEAWADIDGLFNKEALQQYILMAAQAEGGGLRDKPGRPADAYHTLYNLAGLSTAQHNFMPSPALATSLVEQWSAEGAAQAAAGLTLGSAPRDDALRRRVWADMSSWLEDEHQPEAKFVGGKANRINAIHPVLTLTATHARGMLNHFYGQKGIVYV